MSKFVLEVIDSNTGCIAKEIVFDAEMSKLLEIINSTESKIENWEVYDLDLDDIVQIESNFNINFNTHDLPARLRNFIAQDELPYKTHTNRELLLMLNGYKPFSVFSDRYKLSGDDLFYPEEYFRPYVESGKFIKSEYVEIEFNYNQVSATNHVVMYAQKYEAWRIEAYILLRNVWKKTGWSEALELMEGTLLGYKEWENEIHVRNQKDQITRNRPDGTAPVLATPRQDT